MGNIKKPQPKGWKKISFVWKEMLPPSRPSSGDICIYARFLQQEIRARKPYKILILGSTPELRDLASKYCLLGHDLKIFILDINPEMIKAMDTLVEIGNKQEKKVIGDWLKMPFKNQSFDLVLGDEIMINVKEEKRDELLKEVFRVIKPNGAFILRACHVNPRAKRFTVKKSLDKYTNLYFQNKLNLNQVMNYLFEEFFELSYFKSKEGLISLKFLKKDFNKVLNSSNSTRKWLMKEFLSQLGLLSNQCWSWEPKSQQLKRFEKYFKVKKYKAADDYPYSYIFTIYCLKPKK